MPLFSFSLIFEVLVIVYVYDYKETELKCQEFEEFKNQK